MPGVSADRGRQVGGGAAKAGRPPTGTARFQTSGGQTAGGQTAGGQTSGGQTSGSASAGSLGQACPFANRSGACPAKARIERDHGIAAEKTSRSCTQAPDPATQRGPAQIGRER